MYPDFFNTFQELCIRSDSISNSRTSVVISHISLFFFRPHFLPPSRSVFVSLSLSLLSNDITLLLSKLMALAHPSLSLSFVYSIYCVCFFFSFSLSLLTPSFSYLLLIHIFCKSGGLTRIQSHILELCSYIFSIFSFNCLFKR